MPDTLTFTSVHNIPGTHASAAFTSKTSEVFKEEHNIAPIIINDKMKYIPWGGDNQMPYNIIDLIESDETMSTCQMFNAEVCYGSGLVYDTELAIGERNEVEAIFGTSKRVYRANDIRAKLDDTADTWIAACFFAKNVMKFLRGLLCLIFAKLGLKAFKRRISYNIDYLMGVLDPTRGCLVKII